MSSGNRWGPGAKYGGKGAEDKTQSSNGHEETLQARVDAALNHAPCLLGFGALNDLACDLANACETEALVRVWDALGGNKGASGATWIAVKRLHAHSKGRIPVGSLQLPAELRKRLTATRRLHKICKGGRVSARSDNAKEHLACGLAWVASQRADGRSFDVSGGRGRMEVARELKRVLRIDLETARGLLTKLKRKRAFC